MKKLLGLFMLVFSMILITGCIIVGNHYSPYYDGLTHIGEIDGEVYYIRSTYLESRKTSIYKLDTNDKEVEILKIDDYSTFHNLALIYENKIIYKTNPNDYPFIFKIYDKNGNLLDAIDALQSEYCESYFVNYNEPLTIIGDTLYYHTPGNCSDENISDELKYLNRFYIYDLHSLSLTDIIETKTQLTNNYNSIYNLDIVSFFNDDGEHLQYGRGLILKENNEQYWSFILIKVNIEKRTIDIETLVEDHSIKLINSFNDNIYVRKYNKDYGVDLKEIHKTNTKLEYEKGVNVEGYKLNNLNPVILEDKKTLMLERYSEGKTIIKYYDENLDLAREEVINSDCSQVIRISDQKYLCDTIYNSIKDGIYSAIFGYDPKLSTKIIESEIVE